MIIFNHNEQSFKVDAETHFYTKATILFGRDNPAKNGYELYGVGSEDFLIATFESFYEAFDTYQKIMIGLKNEWKVFYI